jgi:peptidoglycan/LPS O-acetylase OafA/YrhL
MTKKHYLELDGIRAIAALMVIFYHFFSTIEAGNPVMKVMQKASVFGQTGVTLFFVLSGFLITRILLATKESDNYFSSFYVRRALRIFPLYYFVLACIYFLLPLMGQADAVPFQKQVSFWTYLQNFAISFNWNQQGPNHFWSLAIEEQFYLFWPFLVYKLSAKILKRLVIGICVLALVLRFVFVLRGYDVFYNTFTRMDALALGALLSLIELKNGIQGRNSGKYLFGMIVLLIPTLALWSIIGGSGLWSVQVVKDTLLGLTYFFLIAFSISVAQNNFFKRALMTTPLKYTGKISYGLYVYHPLCFHFMFVYFKTGNVWIDFLLGTTVCFIVATASYYLLESRFLKLKKFFSYDNGPKRIFKQSQVILES